MCLPKCPFLDRQRTQEQQLGLAVALFVQIQNGQIAHGCSQVWVIWAQRFLQNDNRLAIEPCGLRRSTEEETGFRQVVHESCDRRVLLPGGLVSDGKGLAKEPLCVRVLPLT